MRGAVEHLRDASSGPQSGGSIYPDVNAETLLVGALFLFACADLIMGVRIIEEHERGVVFRLGRFRRVMEPGFHWIVVGVDRLERVELSAVVPEWRSLTREQVEAKLRELAEDGKIRPH